MIKSAGIYTAIQTDNKIHSLTTPTGSFITGALNDQNQLQIPQGFAKQAQKVQIDKDTFTLDVTALDSSTLQNKALLAQLLESIKTQIKNYNRNYFKLAIKQHTGREKNSVDFTLTHDEINQILLAVKENINITEVTILDPSCRGVFNTSLQKTIQDNADLKTHLENISLKLINVEKDQNAMVIP